MNRKLIAALCAACCLSIINISKAQELVSNAGGYASDASASLSWSIGQVTTETYSVSGYLLTQGFHQATITITSISDPFSDLFGIQVYPNPTSSQLYITSDFQGAGLKDCTILLYDMQGSIVLRRTGSLNTMSIDMKDFASSAYLLKVVDPDHLNTKTFQIIKQ